jgi:hypothetical protein
MAPRLLVALVVVLTLSTAAGAQEVVPTDPEAWCGDRHWFKVDRPPGWQRDAMPMGEELTLIYQPPQSGPDAPASGIQLTLHLGAFRGGQPPIDANDVLEQQMALLNAVVGPAEIVLLEVEHPALVTAGVELRGPGGSLAMVVVDPRSGRGSYFRALFVAESGEESSALRNAFEAVVASIRFDPRRWCGPGADGEVVTSRRSGAA